jgi:hypothetical protein
MIFELLFVIVFLASVTTLAAVAVLALRGLRRRALRLLVGYGLGAALYLGAVVLVSVISPQRVLVVGDDRCFDDWCVAAESVAIVSELGRGERAQKAAGTFYVVTLRLSNHARGRPQRASSAAVRLLDGRGRWYEVSPRGQAAFEAEHGPAAPLTATIPVGGSLTTVRVFDLPREARGVGLAVEHPVGFSPGLLVIGDEASLLHTPTIVRLD